MSVRTNTCHHLYRVIVPWYWQIEVIVLDSQRKQQQTTELEQTKYYQTRWQTSVTVVRVSEPIQAYTSHPSLSRREHWLETHIENTIHEEETDKTWAADSRCFQKCLLLPAGRNCELSIARPEATCENQRWRAISDSLATSHLVSPYIYSTRRANSLL